MFVLKLLATVLPALRFTAAPVLVKPRLPCNNPAPAFTPTPTMAPVLLAVNVLLVFAKLLPWTCPTAVTAPALSTLNCEVPFFWRSMKLPAAKLPVVLAMLSKIAVPVKAVPECVSEMKLPAVAPVLDNVRLAAAPAWAMFTAVAAVPEVPFTVSPTTPFTLGLIVLIVVDAGDCTIDPPAPETLQIAALVHTL